LRRIEAGLSDASQPARLAEQGGQIPIGTTGPPPFDIRKSGCDIHGY
jgi:hypothetical protein